MVAGEASDARIVQLRRGVIEYCVMALVERQERYGFDLVRELASTQGMETSEGTIYPILGRLRRDGRVETTWQESPSGPPRRYYRLTNDGSRDLEGFRAQWREFQEAVDLLLEGDPR
jgi:PadR family transcriptional regulator, regulatory protein PadR